MERRDPANGDIRETIGSLKARQDAVDARQDALEERLDDMSADLKMLVAAANMGKGAWWLLLKIGGLVAVVWMVFTWAVEHVPVIKRLMGS